MITFYERWRRTGAGMTLICACLLLTAWLRSLVSIDNVWVQGFGQYHQCILADGSVHWIVRDGQWKPDCHWSSVASTDRYAKTKMLESLLRSEQYGINPDQLTSIQYFAILPYAIPLTLLSACLLLAPSRKQSPPNASPSHA